MAKQTVNLGTAPNDRTGDKLRDAFDKLNDNDTELYAAVEALQESGGSSNAISEGDWSLEANEGMGAGRFRIKYQDSTVASIIIRENGDLAIISNDSVIIGSNDEYELKLDDQGRLILPNGYPIIYRVWDTEAGAGSQGDSYIQAGMGFHFVSGEGIFLHAVNMGDPENPIWHTFSVDTSGQATFPGSQVLATDSPTAGSQSVGAATALTVTNSPNTNWTTGTGILANGINFVVAVDGSGNATVTTINDGGVGHYVGETFGPVAGSAFGGTTPDDNMYFSVSEVDADVINNIDLSKQVHILSGRNYRIPDGVEGQIIYLVNATNNPTGDCWIEVTNGRAGQNVYTDAWYAPFMNDTGVNTAIFTDGAWNFSYGGQWD